MSINDTETRLPPREDASPPEGIPIPAARARPDPDDDATSPDAVFDASVRYVAAGLSVIPIDARERPKSPDVARLPVAIDPADGSRQVSWSRYKFFLLERAELERWHGWGGRYGLAVVCGKVSGGLEAIDFDSLRPAGPLEEAVERRVPGLVQRLVRVRTPRPGRHVYFRSPASGSSRASAGQA